MKIEQRLLPEMLLLGDVFPLQQLILLFKPCAEAGQFQDAALSGTLWTDDSIDTLQIKHHVFHRPNIMNY